MGFFEVLPHIFRINKLINKTVNDIINSGTKILITIDSPGFTSGKFIFFNFNLICH